MLIMFETYSYRDIMYEAFHDGANIISAPKPMLLDDDFDFFHLQLFGDKQQGDLENLDF